MKAPLSAKSAWLLGFCLCLILALPASAGAQTYALSAGASGDLLTLTFPKNAPKPMVLRTGAKRVEILFPAGTTLKPVPGGVAGKQVAAMHVADNVLVVETTTDAFGFVTSPKGGNALQLQVFADPAGSRWKPPADQQPPAQTPPGTTQASGQPQAQAAGQASGQSSAAQPLGAAPASSQVPAGQSPAPEAKPALPPNEVRISLKPQQAPAPATPAPAAPTPAVPTPAVPTPAAPTPAAPTPAAPTPAASTPAAPKSAVPAEAPAPAASVAKPGAAPASTPASTPAPAPAAAQAGTPATSPVPASPPAQPQAATGSPVAQAGTVKRLTTPGEVSARINFNQPGAPAAPQQAQPQSPAQPQAQAQAAPGQKQAQPGPAAGAPGTPPAQPTPGQAPAQAPAQASGPAQGQPQPAAPGASQVTVTLSPMDQAALSAVPKSLDAPPTGKEQQTPPPAQAPDQGQPGNADQTPPGGQPQAKPAEPGADPAKPGEPAEKDSIEDKTYMIGGEQAFAKGDFDKALRVARSLLEKPEISKEMRESALYLQAEALFALYKDTIPEHFLELSDTIQQALNYNTTSWRLPRALIKLGYINLRQGNLPEARAYFNLLRNKYPLDEEVPLIDVHWGDYYMDQAKARDAKANFERAAQAYREVLQKYPESRFARDAALGLSRTQLELNQFAEAAKIIDYIDKRWPRYYIENPAMRRVSADVAYKLGDYAKAKDDYLWYYNLVPGDASNDLVLARLGDVNSKLGKREPAREFYDMAIRMFPGKDGALMAMMRLAEQGIHDAPTLQEMFKAFEDPSDIRPDKIYEIIANDYPKSVLAPLALAKLTMWRLYKQQFPETMDLALRFTKTYPGDDMEKQVVEAGCQAFGKIFPQLLEQMDYKRILELWNKYPFLAANADLLADRERLGVALALYYQGRPKEALTMAEPYLDKGASPDSQKALALMLAIYRENQDWQAILAALRKVAAWRMDENPRRALDFAQAMALEHTGDHARSRLLWARLAQDQNLDPAKRAYAVYYQGRTAYERGDFGKALVWGQDARTLFREAAKDDGKARDALQLMIEANQAAGRYAEALAQCAEFAAESPPDSAEWGANQLRIATLHRLSGDVDSWRKVLEDLRDNQGESLAGRMAASELAASTLEQRAGSLNAPK